MIKVNVFQAHRDSTTSYKQCFCVLSTTLREILEENNVPEAGANVYVNGKYMKPENWKVSFQELQASNPTFISVKHGEEPPKKK